jgi:hypothetical protein
MSGRRYFSKFGKRLPPRHIILTAIIVSLGPRWVAKG